MKARQHLVVFARAPRLGQVKTRLARDIGAVAAWRFYQQTLDRVLRDLAAGPWASWLSLTPASSLLHADRLFGPAARPWCVMDQGGGSLGDRMGRAFRVLPPGPVVIVGSDIPQLRRRHVAMAFQALGKTDTVFGPAPDGGYWLVGARRTPAMPDMFRDVRWSTRHALTDTVGNLGCRYTRTVLEELSDVDDGASWRAWRQRRG